MRAVHSFAIPLLAACVSSVNGEIPNCPYAGAVFPKPTNLPASATMQTALANLTSIFDAWGQDPEHNANGTSWSIQVFSSSTDDPVWEHYHTSPDNVNTTYGVSQVNGDTVYRLGSLTKLFTIMTFMVEAGDSHWNTPITQFIPELAALADEAAADPIMNVDWGEITVGALASQMAGIVRDCEFIPGLLLWHYTNKVLRRYPRGIDAVE
jgi:CubicO group peptidase (beta-lactamase class C family)